MTEAERISRALERIAAALEEIARALAELSQPTEWVSAGIVSKPADKED